MDVTCPGCGRREFKTKADALKHLRICPRSTDPQTPWKLTITDLAFLRGMRIATDES